MWRHTCLVQGSSGSVSCPVPQKLCTSSETLCTSVSFLTAVLPGVGFYFQFSAICQLKAMHILSSAVFQYSGLAQLQNLFLRSFSRTQFQHHLNSCHLGTALVAHLQCICKASAKRQNSPAGQRSHLSFSVMAEVISFFSKAKWKVLLSQVTYSEKEQGKDTVLRDQKQRTLCCVPLVYSISPRKKE